MAAWAGLRLNLVGRILAHLPCLAHRAAFGAVCFNWRAAAAQHPPPPQLPWALLPYAEAHEPVFFCILCGNTHRAFLPDDVRGARCCGSYPGGWLVLALQPQGIDFALHNLHTGERLAVPDFLYTVYGFDWNNMIVLGAALSAAPTEYGACLSVVLDRCPSDIAFWLPGTGMSYVPQPMTPELYKHPLPEILLHTGIDDVIYFAGYGLEGFHAVTDTEKVLIYVPKFGPDGAFTMRALTYRFPDHDVNAEPGCTASRYLLDFFGELVMVVRFVSREDEGTRLIRAYRLRMVGQADNYGDREAYWQRFRFPDSVVVMLGRCSSMAFSSPAVGLDGLYFLDDAKSFHNLMMALWLGPLFTCTDMGRCTVHHHQQHHEFIFPIRSPSEFSPAVWFFP